MKITVAGLLAGSGVTLALVLAGCGSSKVDGTYHQAGGGGVMTLEFHSGKVTSTVMGQSNLRRQRRPGHHAPAGRGRYSVEAKRRWDAGRTSVRNLQEELSDEARKRECAIL